jgi:cyclopropane-fatty-acyl-phospholipid synthase
MGEIGEAAEGLFVVEDVHNFGPDYDRTLMAWHGNFEEAWPRLRKEYDERFRRLWRYYLLASAGAFRARHTQLLQVVLTRPGTRQPGSVRAR